MNTIKPVLEGIYKNSELRKSIIPIFMGNPGLGKTFLINEFVKFAQNNKVNFVDFFGTTGIDPTLTEYIASQMSPMEVTGICMPDKDSKEMVFYNFNKLSKLKDGDIVFFDELPNANPTIFNSLLTLFEGRRLMSGDLLPDVMLVAAGNYQGMMPMTPQIKRRFVWYDVKFNSSMWKDYMFNKYSMINQVSNKLCDLIKNEKFTDYNFHTPADLDKAVNMIINDVPTPYEDVIKPILSTLIENKLENKIKMKDGRTLEVGEQITWLDLIKLKNNVNLTNLIENNKEEIVSISDNEILIFDKDDNIIGEIKNIDTLKLLYYFSDDDIKNIEKGIKTPPPHCLLEVFFFFKKIK